jgi:hypothetical protein
MAGDGSAEVTVEEEAPLPLFLQRSEGVITGTVVSAAVIATFGSTGHTTRELSTALIATSVVYWLAHVYAHAIAAAVTDRHHPWLAIRHAVQRTRSILGAGLLLVAILLLADLVGFSSRGATWVAMDAAIALLGVYGFHAGRRSGLSMAKSLLCGVTGAALGVLVALLKAYVLH